MKGPRGIGLGYLASLSLLIITFYRFGHSSAVGLSAEGGEVIRLCYSFFFCVLSRPGFLQTAWSPNAGLAPVGWDLFLWCSVVCVVGGGEASLTPTNHNLRL